MIEVRLELEVLNKGKTNLENIGHWITNIHFFLQEDKDLYKAIEPNGERSKDLFSKSIYAIFISIYLYSYILTDKIRIG